MLLRGSTLFTILPVSDLERARRFYGQALGLDDLGRSGDGKLLFACASGRIGLMQRPEPHPAEHTAASFEVTDIASAIAALTKRGVEFEDYDLPGLKTVNKVCVLGSEKAAWFKDPDGNILCLHEAV
jgi:catechol 2,3-dioxygenase-like lactoylglutathione lyase family enzyme